VSGTVPRDVTQPRILIRGGIVFSMDPEIGDLERADILVEDGKIVAIGPELDVDATDVLILEASGRIVMPGLIDTHRHTANAAIRQLGADWTLTDSDAYLTDGLKPAFEPEDVYIGNLLGAVEALDSGVTTLWDWANVMHTPEHADAAVTALLDSGIRAVFGYGTPWDEHATWYADEVRRVARQRLASRDQLVTLGLGTRHPHNTSADAMRANIEIGRELAVPISLHVGFGAAGVRQRGVARLRDLDLLGPDLIFVHCSFCTEAEFGLMRDSGCHMSIAPRAAMSFGHGYPPTGRALAAGLRPGLGIDSVLGVSANMFAEMRTALEAERGRHNQQLLESGDRPDVPALRTRDVVEFATIDGACVLGLEAVTGSLSIGKQADIIILRVAPPGLMLVNNLSAAVTWAEPSQVETVLVGGQVRKRDGRLVDHQMESLVTRARRSRERLFRSAAMPSGAARVFA
jgi:cytosine/adenosine deaminase-related metal-dependent hydrolase